MANNMKAYVYESDRGTQYKIKLDSGWAEQVAAGGVDPASGAVSAAALDLDPMPRNMRPRQVLFRAADGYERWLIVCTPDAPAWAPAAIGAIVLSDSDGATHITATRQGRRGERTRRPATD